LGKVVNLFENPPQFTASISENPKSLLSTGMMILLPAIVEASYSSPPFGVIDYFYMQNEVYLRKSV